MRLIFTFFLVNCVCLVYSQGMTALQPPIIRYVTAELGLSLRDQPSRTGHKWLTFAYGGRVVLVGRSENTETIDAITDYWYALSPNPGWGHDFAWVFGGYLSATMPEDTPAVLGSWRIEGQDRSYYWDFDPTYGRAVHGNSAFGGRNLLYNGTSVGGKWVLQGNDLTIQTEWGSNAVPETIKIAVTVINRDRIILRFADGSEHVLIRDNDP